MSYQAIVLENRWPQLEQLLLPIAAAIFFLALGLFAFRRLSGEMVDEL
jgi:ABC-type polysaccharide/polyol phosphate export permease